MKTKIKIKLLDFWANPEDIWLYQLLASHYQLVDSPYPDFILYSNTSQKNRKYQDCIRIFYTGENIRPDFTTCDFAFSFDYLEDPRNYRLPLYRLYYPLEKLTKPKNILKIFSSKEKFCNFIYSNNHPSVRKQFFHQLCLYKRVDAAGKVLNNMGEKLGAIEADKKHFQNPYKFTIAFENSSYPGYTTEKILHAFIAHSIPIYWGNPLVAREFNPKAFINCHDYPDFEAVIKRIVEIDEDDSLFREILAQPVFPNNKLPEFLQEATILKRFDSIFHSKK